MININPRMLPRLDEIEADLLARRARAQLGWTLGPVDPASALLQAHDVDTLWLRSQLDRMP